jgi:hypothetical protein
MQERRPDTSKNGLMKRNQLDIRRAEVKERGRSVLSRLGKKQQENRTSPRSE